MLHSLKESHARSSSSQSHHKEPKPAPRGEKQINIMTPDRDRDKEKEKEKELLASQSRPLLSDVERVSMELETTVRHMATALASLHDCDQLIGLQAWYKKFLKQPLYDHLFLIRSDRFV